MARRQIHFGLKAQLSLVVCFVAMFCLGMLSVASVSFQTQGYGLLLIVYNF